MRSPAANVDVPRSAVSDFDASVVIDSVGSAASVPPTVGPRVNVPAEPAADSTAEMATMTPAHGARYSVTAFSAADATWIAVSWTSVWLAAMLSWLNISGTIGYGVGFRRAWVNDD